MRISYSSFPKCLCQVVKPSNFFVFIFLAPCLFYFFKYKQSWSKITRQVWKKLKQISEMKSKNPHLLISMLVVLEIELLFQHWNWGQGEGIIATCVDIFWPGFSKEILDLVNFIRFFFFSNATAPGRLNVIIETIFFKC